MQWTSRHDVKRPVLLAEEEKGADGDAKQEGAEGSVNINSLSKLTVGPPPTQCFYICTGLPYYVADRRGESKGLLFVPLSQFNAVITLAHPLAGHLEATDAQIWGRFHWPDMTVEVHNVCQHCPTCQRSTPRVPTPSKLIPLSIIDNPLDRISMDIVGPLPSRSVVRNISSCF